MQKETDSHVFRNCVELIDHHVRISMRCSREQRHEMINDFFPRLQLLVQRYRENGASLDQYVITSFRLYLRNRHRRDGRYRHLQLLCDEGGMEENGFPGCVASPAENYSAKSDLQPWLKVIRTMGPQENQDDCTRTWTRCRVTSVRKPTRGRPTPPGRHGDSARRFTLFVLCKNLPGFGLQDLPRIADRFSLPLPYLTGLWMNACAMTEAQIERRRVTERSRDRHYTALLEYQRQEREADHPQDQSRFRMLAAFHRSRLDSARLRLMRPVQLTHHQISTLLGVPKGTIDSLISKMRGRLAHDENLTYARRA